MRALNRTFALGCWIRQDRANFFVLKKIFFLLMLSLCAFQNLGISAKKEKNEFSFSQNENPAGKKVYSHFLNALILERYGELERALKEYSRTLALEPQASLIYQQRANLYLKMGQPEKALPDAQAFYKLHPEDPEASLFLASIHLMLDQKITARQILEKSIEENPKYIPSLIELSNILLFEDSPKAIKILENILKIDPFSIQAYYSLGLVYQKMEEFPKAKNMFEKVIEIDPESVPSLLFLGETYEKENNLESAILYFEKALKKAPEHFSLRMQLISLYSKLKQFDKIENLLQIYLNDPSPPMEANFWLALVYENKKQWEKALFYYLQAQKGMNNPELHIRAASVYSQLGESKNALRSLKTAVKLSPQEAQFHYFLGLAYLDLKKPKKAIKEFEKAIELKKDFASSYFQLGIALDSIKKWPEAEKMFKHVIKIDPTNASAYNYLGYTYADRNENLFEARKLIEKALEIDQDNPAYADSLGWLNFREGDILRAISHLKSAVESMPDPAIFDHLGDCYHALGNSLEAALSYRQALELDPKNKTIRKKLERYKKWLLPESPARKLLKNFEKTLSETPYLSGMILLKGKKNFIAKGSSSGFFYLRKTNPSHQLSTTTITELRMDLGLSAQMPVTLRYESNAISQWTVFPPEIKEQMPQETKKLLEIIASFFDNKLLLPLDQWQTEVQEKSKHYILTYQDRSLTLKKKTGLVETILWGNTILKIEKYQNINRNFFPQKIKIKSLNKNETDLKEIEIEFSRLSLDTIENKIFKAKE
ncbi:MAG: hypothetical protein A3I11_00580 [Elusimicrobia bacterium RIFCSPLOWO2_02_FULL_39_32]|nr:MAG: hypothetical protein A3B80_07605 [Elusimicrobia bacterium RIFCSPHIGHO2_02_FULL_39_36]OGR92530.1 MAG: hypothetical protein A3I11_00580 [Elusimicrobia bacterium RIFCSPLOWO2_02_FULL_39_32]OGR99178.1 MAG: hypothetical protein A3G85_05790 [Elusimicrobia bacterium RIFCSPLOWO2_12_FULL_39_28]